MDADCPAITVYDSHKMSALYPAYDQKYAGQKWDKDFLWGYVEYAGYHSNFAHDPLSTQGFSENFQWRAPDDPENPDDGTSASVYTFKVLYQNDAGLPPIQYIDTFGGPIGDGGIWKLTSEEKTGVVLYLKHEDDADYIALPMQKEDPDATNYAEGVVYKYVIAPDG